MQARLGTPAPAETLDTYSLWPDSDDKTPEAVDAYPGPLADQHVIERA